METAWKREEIASVNHDKGCGTSSIGFVPVFLKFIY
jgi:hypothetical protein